MKVKYIKSSCVVVESNGLKILTDPWLVDGEYYGSWSHYPPLQINHDYFKKIDYIYISHIHPDHFSKKSLQILDKKIPVLIHEYATPFLKLNIESLGFNVQELPHNKKTQLKNGVTIDILAADNCNPELCSKFMGCGIIETKYKSTQIDSLSVISDGKYNILNLNDCPFDLAQEAVNIVKSKYNKIDFLLVGYAGAGPYPQCFELSDQERFKAESFKKNQFLNQGEKYIDLIKPDFYMPFAGTYTLTGSLSNMQNKRGVPELDESLIYFKNSDIIDHNICKPILLNSYEYFNLETQKSSKDYIPIDLKKKQQYINKVLSKRKLDYENDEIPSIDSILELIPNSFLRMNRKREEINFKSNTKVFIKLTNNQSIEIPFNGQKFKVIDINELCEIESFVEYKLDLRLLKRILKGPKYAHWNNAEIGSHIQFRRIPNNFERGLYHCMNFFHC